MQKNYAQKPSRSFSNISKYEKSKMFKTSFLICRQNNLYVFLRSTQLIAINYCYFSTKHASSDINIVIIRAPIYCKGLQFWRKSFRVEIRNFANQYENTKFRAFSRNFVTFYIILFVVFCIFFSFEKYIIKQNKILFRFAKSHNLPLKSTTKNEISSETLSTIRISNIRVSNLLAFI